MLNGKEVIYLQMHRFRKRLTMERIATSITLKMCILMRKAEKMLLKFGGCREELASTKSAEPLFQIITPNICNSIDLDSPLGVSVCANGIDGVKGCDLIYDSYMNEFVLGRKRIAVPSTWREGRWRRMGLLASDIHDPDDTVYYLLPEDKNGNNQLTGSRYVNSCAGT